MDEFFKCAECGMTIIGREYHPYTACVLFRQTRQAEKVRSMLHQVALYGYEAAQAGVSVDAALDDITATAPAAEAERESNAAKAVRSINWDEDGISAAGHGSGE